MCKSRQTGKAHSVQRRWPRMPQKTVNVSKCKAIKMKMAEFQQCVVNDNGKQVEEKWIDITKKNLGMNE